MPVRRDTFYIQPMTHRTPIRRALTATDAPNNNYDIIKIGRDVSQVNDVVNIMTAGRKLAVPLSRVEETIFLKRLVVRDAAFHTLAEVGDGGNGRSSGRRRRCRW
jgi:hypothetical protein